MTLQQITDQLALKALVDTFSNLADEKKVAEQMALFTTDANVTTYIDGQLFADMHGTADIEKVFTEFLANFTTVYHLNGQHSVTLIDDNNATAINYCLVKLVSENNEQKQVHTHSVRYQDTYIKQNNTWLIKKRIATFMISEIA